MINVVSVTEMQAPSLKLILNVKIQKKYTDFFMEKLLKWNFLPYLVLALIFVIDFLSWH